MIAPNPYAQPPRARNRNGVLWCWRPWRRPQCPTGTFTQPGTAGMVTVGSSSRFRSIVRVSAPVTEHDSDDDDGEPR
jgi:hypothetical protein